MSTTTLLISPITGTLLLMVSYVFLIFLVIFLYIFFPIKKKDKIINLK
jgi:hypothetical protein